MKFIIYDANVTGKQSNCLYPNRVEVTSIEELAEAVEKDHVCARYKDNYRNIANFEESDVVVMDVDNDHSDNPDEWITPESLEDELADIQYAITFSRNHMKQKGKKSARPRFHVYFQIAVCSDALKYAALKKRIYAAYPFFDGNALDAGRFIYGCKSKEVIWHDGPNTIESLLNAQENSNRYTIPEGKRNATLSRFAGRVVKRYGWNDASRGIFLEEADKCDPPLEDDELKKIWNSAKKFERVVTSQEGYIPPEQYTPLPKGPAGSLKPFDYSDIGQAKVLSNEYADELRFNPATGYLRYDTVRWDESLEQSVGAAEEFLDLQLADAQLLVFQARQALLNIGSDPAVIKAGGKRALDALNEEQVRLYGEYLNAVGYQAFVMKRRDWKYIKSAMEAAKPMVFIKYDELDKDPFLLNTPEGTYDLRLGMSGRREHDAKDYLTKVTAVEPGDTGDAIWQDCIQTIFLKDQELIRYVQEVVGLAAIGKVNVEALIIAYGDGRNGKSTFWNTLAHVLGTYAGSIASDILTVNCRRNAAPEKAEMKGKRLIIAAELEEGMRLNTSIVKQLCSTDPIRGEKKYKDPADFVPSHQLVLYTNHLPKVGATDAGIWRRLIVIPFNAEFEGSSDKKNYADYLYENAAPAVLKWIIEGAKRVIEKEYHITPPQCVRDAITKYREENNWLGHFIDECCDVDPQYTERSGELYAAYRDYAGRMGAYVRSNVDFAAALDVAGFNRRKTKKGVIVEGLRIRVDDFME